MNGACEADVGNANWSRELKILGGFAAVFILLFFLPVGVPRFDNALKEGLELTKWYAQEHVLLCLIPALFIAGGISAFVNQASVMRYLGPKANKALAYGVASVSGTILAVCSCTVLPLFGGIWMRGAGLGPATAFLYSGPAINVLAIVMTARILGMELGTARAIGAVAFSVIVGFAMHLVFRREEQAKAEAAAEMPEVEVKRPLWQNVLFFASMVGVLVFANWSKPAETTGLWAEIFAWKWPVAAAFAAGLGVALGLWFGFKWRELALAALPVVILSFAFPHEPLIAFIVGCAGLAVLCARNPGEGREWLDATWTLGKQIFPLLIGGVFVSGMLLGRPGQEGLIPSVWVSQSVGGNSFMANFVSSIVGAFMYFATLTEVPILQGLMGSGMGKGPALALLLAGPALSLPSMLVLRSIMGTKKVVVYVVLVVIMATITGLIYGALF
ncbi:MAG TPA: permease [Candidatus Paceibacterota bacterium]|nr:permease [Verrucomicrobiota bacterium]HSA10618.1 permease [Candidatus Paceibacterota bacterium]